MHQSYTRPGSAAAAVPAIAATAGEYSSDEILVERIAAGDKLAMQVLFARHRTSIVAVRFVGNEPRPRTSERRVLDVWQQAGRLKPFRRLDLAALDRPLRRSAHRRRTDAPLDETIEATVADSADDPEIALQKKSRSELLRQAVMKLSPDHREIIDLIYYHEKSVDDCALILGIPAATVKTRMFYARKKLAELVQAH